MQKLKKFDGLCILLKSKHFILILKYFLGKTSFMIHNFDPLFLIPWKPYYPFISKKRSFHHFWIAFPAECHILIGPLQIRSNFLSSVCVMLIHQIACHYYHCFSWFKFLIKPFVKTAVRTQSWRLLFYKKLTGIISRLTIRVIHYAKKNRKHASVTKFQWILNAFYRIETDNVTIWDTFPTWMEFDKFLTKWNLNQLWQFLPFIHFVKSGIMVTFDNAWYFWKWAWQAECMMVIPPILTTENTRVGNYSIIWSTAMLLQMLCCCGITH